MILWLIDPLSKLKTEKDSSFFLAYLASEGGAKNYFTHEVYLEDSEPKCLAYELEISVDPNKFPGNIVTKKGEAKVVALSQFKKILNRLEPPIDEKYLTQCRILTLHNEKHGGVINSPVALQAYSEKLLPLIFEKGIPTSIGIEKAPEDGIIKPMNIFGGTGVEKTTKGTPISKDQVYQPFRSEILKGEKRYFILGNSAFGEVLKTPAEKEFRSNSAHGSTLSNHAADPKLLERTKALIPKLKNIGIQIAAVDFVGDEIIEINFTCPSLWNFLYKDLSEELREEMKTCLKKVLA